MALEIEADGFLYNMVRAIVGTLVEVGRGVRGEEWPGRGLAGRGSPAAGPTAPPQGLFLVGVTYRDLRAGQRGPVYLAARLTPCVFTRFPPNSLPPKPRCPKEVGPVD